MFKNFSKKYDGKNGLIFILCISAVFKILLLLFNKPFNTDGVLYISAAQYFDSGHFREGLALFPMPLYSFLITSVHFFVPDWEAAAKLISIASVVLTTIPLYLLTTDLFNRRAAFWGCLAFAVSPLPNDWALDVIRGPVFVFFVLWAVYFAQNAIESKRPVFFFLTALFSCVSLLLRTEGVILIPFFFLFTMCLLLKKRDEKRPLIKGILTWMALLTIFAGICFWITRMSEIPFNRFDKVAEKTENTLKMDFLDNYYLIYDQLKDMEKLSPFPCGRQNFAEIARHFMPVIYLLGLLQIFVKVLFPLFLIPLFWTYRHIFERRQVFVFALVCFYLLIIYVTLIDRDFMQRRFLFAPVALAYPWVGLGMERIFNRLKSSSKPKVYLVIFLAVFVFSPVFKCVYSVAKTDNVLRQAGQWMATNVTLTKTKLMTNDARAPFFAGMKINEYFIYKHNANKYDFSAMEKFALEKQVDILFIKVPKKRSASLSHISYYKQIKKFTGKKRNVYIYCSPAFCKNTLSTAS
ncbi:MAG: ArnT family glycosyltransferase [Dissulfuribacterales bacterium]